MKPLFYTQAAFATLAGVPVEMVAQWIKKGAIDSVKLGKNRLVLFTGVIQ